MVSVEGRVNIKNGGNEMECSILERQNIIKLGDSS